MILKLYHFNMKLLTRDTDYAVRAICAIAARQGKIVTADELVDELNIPRPFLRKILQSLSKRGVIRSCRGFGGGFTLVSNLDRLTLADIIEAFQGPLSINECALKKKACPNRIGCPLKKRIDAIEGRVVRELRSIAIGSLLKKGNK